MTQTGVASQPIRDDGRGASLDGTPHTAVYCSKGLPMFVLVFALATIASRLIGYPVDVLRRSSRRGWATVAALINAALLIAFVGALATSGLLAGWEATAALVLGVVTGNVAADAVASKLLGPAAREW